MWIQARAASSKGTVSSVPAWFRADSGTNLIKKGEIVTGRSCGSVAQWSGCLYGLRKVLGSSPGQAMCFFVPCDIWWPVCVWGRGGSNVTGEEKAYGPTATRTQNLSQTVRAL